MLADIGIPLAGTLACQVVGFTLEPLGFAVKRPSWLEGPGGWRQSWSHCLGRWREGKAGWTEAKEEEDKRGGGCRGGGRRESSKWLQGAGPTWRKRSKQDATAENLERIHHPTYCDRQMCKAVLCISPSYWYNCITCYLDSLYICFSRIWIRKKQLSCLLWQEHASVSKIKKLGPSVVICMWRCTS